MKKNKKDIEELKKNINYGNFIQKSLLNNNLLNKENKILLHKLK